MATTVPPNPIPIPQVPEVPATHIPDPNPKAEYTKPPTLGPMYLEASALLLLWSFMVFIEGAVRLQSLTLSNLGDNSELEADPVALFVGALFEIFFALMGLALGTMGLIFRWFYGPAIKIAMMIQGILGIYVFIAFAIVQPAHISANLKDPLAPNGVEDGFPTKNLFRALTTFNILTAIHMCFALLGGQFMLMARMIGAASGEDFLKALSGTKMRAIFWHVNWMLAGLWTLAYGCAWRANEGTADPVLGNVPIGPHAPGSIGYMIFVGVLVVLWAGFGTFLAVKRFTRQLVTYYLMGVGIVFIFEIVNYSLVQFGKLNNGLSGPAAVLAGLTVAVTALGPYFLWQLEKETDDVKDTEKV